MPVPPDATRRRILDASAALLTKDSGASLAEIATAAGVGRTTVHRAFPTRADLLQALALDAVERVDAAVSTALSRAGTKDPRRLLTAIADEVLPLADELRFLDAGAEVWDLPEMVERWYQITGPLEQVVRGWRRRGLVDPDMPVAWIVDLIAGTLLTAKTAVTDGRIAPRDASRLVVDSVLRGVRAP